MSKTEHEVDGLSFILHFSSFWQWCIKSNLALRFANEAATSLSGGRDREYKNGAALDQLVTLAAHCQLVDVEFITWLAFVEFLFSTSPISFVSTSSTPSCGCTFPLENNNEIRIKSCAEIKLEAFRILFFFSIHTVYWYVLVIALLFVCCGGIEIWTQSKFGDRI